MSKTQRISSFFTGLLMMAAAVFMTVYPEEGYILIIVILSLGLMIRGIRSIIYYITMGIHMVGGRRSLYSGILILDLGLFTANLSDVPRIYVLLYLLGIHLFSGLVDMLNAMDERKLGAGHWRLKLSSGIVNIFIGLSCLIFIRYANSVVYIYCLGLFYNGIMKMVDAFRKTSMVYIQ
ncbi:MAG: DUF308 domain-containing protein [Lachnospiraceae bacterium]|nr:DUF308 domain-containing protein [Lachnospiraceae bacterium]